MKIYIGLFALIFMQGCSSDGDNNDSSQITETNLLGTWNYKFTNSACVDVTTTGTRTFESLDGDLTKIGNVLWLGEVVARDNNGDCVVNIINNIEVTWIGRPAIQTSADYIAYRTSELLNIPDFKEFQVVFSEDKIDETIVYKDGFTIRFTLTR